MSIIFGSSSVWEPVTLTSDVKQKIQGSQHYRPLILILTTASKQIKTSHNKNKNFTGFYTEGDPNF